MLLGLSCVTEGCDDGADAACVCESGYHRGESRVCVEDTTCECYDEKGVVHDRNAVDVNNATCLQCSCNSSNMYSCNPLANCCVVSDWSSWSDCDSACGPGIQQRTRMAITGDSCGLLSYSDTRPCEGLCECNYKGEIFHNGATFIDEAICKKCVCEDSVSVCNEDLVVDGGYGLWSSWDMSSCAGNNMCVNNMKTRTRQCNSPEPICGGSQCDGPSTDTEPCLNVSCCYLKTSDWTDCSKPCYSSAESRGTRSRTQFYTNSSCGQPQMEVEECGEPCDCVNNYPWSTWSTCDDQCGLVAVSRTRGTSDNPNCMTLPDIDMRMCYSQNCNCTEPNTVYSNTSSCEQTCENMTPSGDCTNVIKSGCVCTGNTFRKGDQCVSQADCYTCLVNGSVYENNSLIPAPLDACKECRCTDGKKVCYKNCTDVANCLPNEVLVHDRCCYKCKPKSDLCGLKYKSVGILVDQCTTSNMTVPFCEGTCDASYYNLDPITGAPTSSCRCCTPVTMTTVQQNVTCDDTSQKTVTLKEIQSCSCTSCVPGG